MKRTLSFLLACLLVLGLFPVRAYAQETEALETIPVETAAAVETIAETTTAETIPETTAVILEETAEETLPEEQPSEEDLANWQDVRDAFTALVPQDEDTQDEEVEEPTGEEAIEPPVLNGVGDRIFNESEPNNTMSTADRIYHDYTVAGTLSSTDRLDYFKVVLTQRSTITVVSTATRRNFMIGIMDTSGEALAAGTDLGYSDGYYSDGFTCTLNAGTYYIVPVDSDARANQYMFYLEIKSSGSSHTHSYTSKVTNPTCGAQGYTTYTCSCGDSYKGNYTDATRNHTYSSTSDTSCNVCGYIRQVDDGGSSGGIVDTGNGGTSAGNAINVTLGTTYRKNWTKSNYNKMHYAKFTIPERGIVTFKITKPYDSDGDVCDFDFVIYNIDGDAIFGNECYKAKDSVKSYYEFNCGLNAGTYYFSAAPSFYVNSGTIPMDYTITHTANPYCEIEPNETTTEATELVFAKMHKAFFGSDGYDSRNDYFKFETIKGHEYMIKMENFDALDKTTALMYLIGYEQKNLANMLDGEVGADGTHACFFTAPTSQTYYIQIRNYNLQPIEYGIFVTDLSEHYHMYGVKDVTKSTCTQQGYTTYMCPCGDSYKGNYTPATGHKEVTVKGTAATCTATGKTEGKKCSTCGTVTVKQTTIPALDHDYVNYVCTRCGVADPDAPDPAAVTRVKGSDRHETAFKIANMMKEVLGIEKFDTILIASGVDSADALAGSYLAAMKQAPILLSRNNSHPKNLAYIQENLSENGIVYILGGTGAVPQAMEDLLIQNGIRYERVKGSDRFGTNIEILKKAGGIQGSEILVSTAYNFADSLSASATGKPILLVNSKRNSLNNAQKAYLAEITANGPKIFTIIGGTGAVSDALAAELSAYGTVNREKGTTREATSVRVAEVYFQNPDTVFLAYSRNFPDGLCGGPLAYIMKAPLLLVNKKQEGPAKEYVAANGITHGYILGGSAAVSAGSAQIIFGQ